MRRIPRPLSIAPCFVLAFFALSAEGGEFDSLLMQLEEDMSRRAVYDSAQDRRLESLKALLEDKSLEPRQRYAVHRRLVEGYEVYVFDSAIAYVLRNRKLAERLGDSALRSDSDLSLARLLARSGRYKEAFDVIERLDFDALPESQRVDYRLICKKAYGDLKFYTKIEESRLHYLRLFEAHRDSLLAALEPGTEARLRIREEQRLDERDLEACRLINSQRLAMTRMGERDYSLATFQRSLPYQVEGKAEQQKKHLVLSAISDVRGAVKDNASLATLALILYREGDLERAYRYINFAFEDASFYNSRLRFLEISNVLPLIDAAYQAETERQKRLLRQLLAALAVLTVVVVGAAASILVQMRRIGRHRRELSSANDRLNALNAELSAANDQLSGLYGDLYEANRLKEQYIGSFLSICAEFIDKLEEQQNLVRRMVLARKFDEILSKIKSNELIKKEVREFYANFDDAFLSIYPDFVERLNALLRPEESVLPKGVERMSTELRVFALIRLGIEDSSQIARLLRYSVNTIYNYRARLKNKAADREEFEEQIKRIGAFGRGNGG